MKVCFFTLGTRGDVQPYVALGRELIREGHEAVICVGESFHRLVETNGIRYAPTTSDLMAVAASPEGKAILEHPIRNLKLALRYSKEVINPAYRKTLEEFFSAADDADVIVYHPKALGAVDIALTLGIPCVSMPPVPVTYPVSEFAHIAVTTKSLGKWLNKLTYRANEMAESSQIHLINDFRVKVLQRPKRKAGIYTYTDGRKEIPIVYPLSKALFPDVSSWDGHVFMPGFFFLDSEGETLPDEVEQFLVAGKQPVAVTFSSMPLAQPVRFLEKLRSALETSGNRAVVVTGNSGIECENDGLICAVKATPHSVLFPRVKGIIHHGGIGTMAAALKAGKPQMIIPFSVDQPFWAKRLYRLGYSLKPMREKEVTAAALASAFAEMDKPDVVRRAEQIAAIINSEKATVDTVKYIAEITCSYK
ncbi:MAG: glycosyltransferase family 1 protein [Clostridiales bacterium]|mgnify:CR=1 FL=1|nr:glycosyltransferase family 1 protein [Clostridiales bacterium]